MTLQHEPVRRAHIFMQPRDTGTQRGSGREAAAAVHGDPAHATQAAQNTAGGERDFYLFSPSSPGISKPWPWPFVLRGSRQQEARGTHGPGLGTRLRCGSARAAASHSAGCRASGAGGPSTARLWQLASRASPGPGRWLKGCLPGPGCFSGAGHSSSSADSGFLFLCLACLLRWKAGRQIQFLAKDDKPAK